MISFDFSISLESDDSVEAFEAASSLFILS